MTTPDPITTAREALKRIADIDFSESVPDNTRIRADADYQIIHAALDYAEKLKAEVTRLHKVGDHWHMNWQKIVQGVIGARPLCRDCADEDGTCPHSGLPCDTSDEVVERFHRLTSQLDLYKAALEEIRSSTADGYAHRIATNALKDRQAKTDGEAS